MKYILFILLIIVLTYSAGCKKVYPETPLQFDSLDQSGGNLARFVVLGDYLCTVNGSLIKVYNVKNPSNPTFVGNVDMGVTVLSLRTYKDSLLVIGTLSGSYSQNTLAVYSFKNTPSIQLIGTLNPSQAYDPFTNQSNYLFTTQLAGAGPSYYVPVSCLQIYNLKQLNAPKYTIEQNIYSPLDLVANGNNLFVCDDGLKVFDITDVSKIALKKHFNIEAQNILYQDGTLSILGTTGLFQYEYVNDTINLLSKINIVTKP